MCWIKLITLSFWVHVKFFYSVVSYHIVIETKTSTEIITGPTINLRDQKTRFPVGYSNLVIFLWSMIHCFDWCNIFMRACSWSTDPVAWVWRERNTDAYFGRAKELRWNCTEKRRKCISCVCAYRVCLNCVCVWSLEGDTVHCQDYIAELHTLINNCQCRSTVLNVILTQ